MIRVHGELDQVSEEHPHKYESQSNGATEVAVRELRGQFRTLKSCLESKLGEELNPTHPVSMWLLGHAANILTVRAVGTDGKTLWRRIKGREFGIRMVGFAEQVMYKLPMKGPEKLKRGNAAGNFEKATYIGLNKVNCGHRFINQK